MKNTENYGFNLPEKGEFYNVDDFNENFEGIDGKLKEFEDGTTTVGNANKLGGKSASEYLTTSGGTISNNTLAPLTLKTTSGHDVLLSFVGESGTVGNLGFNGVGNPAYKPSGVNTYYSLFHSGNKPTGSYTGNGSATSRTINVGGIGQHLIISVRDVKSFVGYTGALVVSPEKTQWYGASIVNYRNGVLFVASDSSYFNANGSSYSYSDF